MCIIVYKPEGSPMPPADTLRRCFEENPDGAGLMWPENGRVMLRKGFMDWGALSHAISNELPRDARELPVALHFRIATHGRVKPGCCHPFAVCKDYKTMRAQSVSAAVGFMHNGTLAGLETSQDVSDSMAYARNVLAPLKEMRGDLSGAAQRRIVEATSQGSRFLLMTGGARVLTFGRWMTDGGCLFSNESFRGRRASSPLWGGGSQPSLFDTPQTLERSSHPRQGRLFPVCRTCPLVEECVDLGPWCEDEAEAEEMSSMPL